MPAGTIHIVDGNLRAGGNSDTIILVLDVNIV